MYEILIDNIRAVVSISEQDELKLKEAFVPVVVKKKDFLLRKGDPSNHMRLVASGCLKVFSVNDEGTERILQFGIAGWWVNDLYAYLTHKPATFSIQAITDSEVLQIHRKRLDQLFDEVRLMDRFFRIKTQNGYVALQERTIHTMSLSAEQRYLEFVSRHRQMEQQIPQYMIASYLGITPEHLSTIRKSMSLRDRS